jgi:hypothetical protein
MTVRLMSLYKEDPSYGPIECDWVSFDDLRFTYSSENNTVCYPLRQGSSYTLVCERNGEQDRRHLASALKKMLPAKLLAEVVAHLDPLGHFLKVLRDDSNSQS